MTRFKPHASLDDVARSLTLLGVVVAIAGALLIVGPAGYFNPLRFGRYFIAIGLVGLLVPGVVGAASGAFVIRRARWAWPMAVGAATAQAIVATLAFAGQFFLTPISPVPLLGCLLWATASAWIAVDLARYRHAMVSDVRVSRGFDVEAR